MGAGCCAHLSSRKFRPLDSDMDVIDTAMAYESDAGELIIPLFVAWADHVGSTCIRRVGGTDVTVRVPRDEGDAATTTTTTSPGGRGKDVLKILYGPNTIPLLKVRPGVIGATSEDPHVVVDAKKGTRVKCKVFEFSYNYVSNIMHVWRLWYPLETLASPDSNHPPTNVLPYKVTHRIHSSVRRDETIVWEIAEGEDNNNNVERNHTSSSSSDALPCVQYVMTAGAAGGAPSSDQPSTEPLSLKKICFLSLKAPGWVVQVGERTELIVDYHVNPDMSLDAFLVKPLNKGEELLYLAHVSQ
eukprot:PhF_6_TR20837/c0_g1_i3/m.30008